MSESGDSAASFREEPVFFEDHDRVEEPETQPLDFDDEQDGRESPFIEQMPPTPPPNPTHALEAQAPALPTTPSKIAQFASKMGMVSDPVQRNPDVPVLNDAVQEEQRAAAVLKRSAKITLSPSKTIKRKRLGCVDAVSTFIFMDLETTGRINGDMDSHRRHLENKLRDPQDFSNALSAVILETQRSEYPRITEMSFISVPREMFIRGQAKMKELCDSGNTGCLRLRLAGNVHTRQINPQLDERQWGIYEASRLEGKSCLNHAREDLILKHTFAQEWPAVRAFLDSCPKPACLVAHNGLCFDYRVLYGELTRCGFIEKDMGIPEGVVFVDSWLAIKEVEETHRNELHHATKLVDWKMLSDQVSLSRVPACEDIPAAVEEEPVSTEAVSEEMNVTLNLAPQLPNDPRTPSRPPPPRSSHSEPAKLCGRRRLFEEELQHSDHPLLFLNAEEWSPAKRRRIRPEFFKRLMGGRWDFNRTVAQMNTKNKLTTIYETVLKAQYDAHYAQDDTEALMQLPRVPPRQNVTRRVCEGQLPQGHTWAECARRVPVVVSMAFAPVPAIFAPSQQRGHDIAVYIFPHDHSLCYEFFFHCRSADARTETYLCCGCKALKTKDNKMYRQPIPSVKLRDGYFISDPMNPFRPHFCLPRSTPQATTRRLIIERCNELRAGPSGKPTRNVVDELLSDITSPKFDAFPMTERRAMVEQIASPYGNARDNLRRTLQRNQKKGLNPQPDRPRLTGKTRKPREIKREIITEDSETPAEVITHAKPNVEVTRKRFSCSEPIRTFVFMDLATTGMFAGYSEAQRRISPELLRDDEMCANALHRLIMETEVNEYPRITEMSFLSIPRDIFTRGQKTIQSLCQEAPDRSFVLRLAANVRTCQVNPELDEEQWEAYQNVRASDSAVVPRPRHDLEVKRTFYEEWLAMRAFLDECPKPVCLVAHNGIFFDYRVLYGELMRHGFIDIGLGIPKGVVFVDSVLAIREIEGGYLREVAEATKELASQRACHDVAAYEDITAEDNQDVSPSTCFAQGDSKDVAHPQSPAVKRNRLSNGRDTSKYTLSKLDGQPYDEHPLSVFNIQDWPPAKMRRIRPEFFKQNSHGGWEFNYVAAKNALRDDLAVLYETVVKTQYGAHFTQDDAEALVQICVAYGKGFQDYVDYNAAHFPF
ncbi:hypothetical protein Aduo_014269 [Ancylostoma duodenale]